jgi:hypothetical protein
MQADAACSVRASACCGKPPLCHSACPQPCRNQASARVASRAVRAQRWLVAAHHVLSTICSCPDTTMHPLAFSHVHTREHTFMNMCNSLQHLSTSCHLSMRTMRTWSPVDRVDVLHRGRCHPVVHSRFAWHVHTNAHTRTNAHMHCTRVHSYHVRSRSS